MTLSGDNIASIRRSNRASVLYQLLENGPVSRKMLADSMDLTPAAITKIVGGMIEEGLLVEGTTLRNAHSAGRSQVLLEINPKAWCGLGVKLNVHETIVSAVWLDGTVVFSEKVPLPLNAEAEAAVDLLCKRLMALVDAAGLPKDRILGVGLAVRGIVDLSSRTVVDSFGALRERNVPLVELFERRLGLPTVMDNNVRSLFAAQMFLSRDRQETSQLFVRCEYGIGAALSVGSDIWNGGNGRCSEIGHIQVVRRGGKPCFCGKSGCLETIASPDAILRDALEMMSPTRTPLLWARKQSGADIGLDDVLECARGGDAGVGRIVDRAVRLLAAALKSAVYIVDPQKIVLYGRLFENQYFLSCLEAEMLEGLDRDHMSVRVEKSPFNTLLEPIAAGILIVERFFRNGGIPLDGRKETSA